MKPIQAHETQVWPENQEHTCTHPECENWARAHNLDKIFGWRRMGDGFVRIQAQCKVCRSKQSKGELPAPVDVSTFERVRGGAPGVVYLIHATDRGMTKIGYTTSAPEQRLRTFQTGHFDELVLIGYYSADIYGEKEAHEDLDDRRVRGEWFSLDSAAARRLIEGKGGYIAGEGLNDDAEAYMVAAGGGAC